MMHRITCCLAVLSLGLVALLVPSHLMGQCLVSGHINACTGSPHPELGEWEYTMEFEWDTGSSMGLRHFDILVDEIERACSNQQLQNGVVPGDTTGFSRDEPVGRTYVYYFSEWLFDGDPYVPEPGKMFKFEPFEDQNEVPGPTGVGTFKFYSDYAPVPVAAANLYLVDTEGYLACIGEITGYFPGLACNPIRTERASWGMLKSIYGE